DEKIERDLTPEKEAQPADLQKQQAELRKQIGPDTPLTKQLTTQLNKLRSDQANMEFELNNRKAKLAVLESNLQDAITAGDKDKVARLRKEIEAPRRDVEQRTEALATKKDEVERAQKELTDHTAPLDAI